MWGARRVEAGKFTCFYSYTGFSAGKLHVGPFNMDLSASKNSGFRS